MEFERLCYLGVIIMVVLLVAFLIVAFLPTNSASKTKLTLRKKVNNFYGLCGWRYEYLEVDYFGLFPSRYYLLDGEYAGYELIKINGKDVN